MKVFTREEKRILLYLSALLFIGLLVREGRDFFSSSSAAERAEQKATLEIFQEGSHRYLASADSGAMALWSFGLASPVNVNRANQEELQALPGIGPVLAKKIIDYRDKNGYFRTVQDLIEVKGIGPKLLLRWEGLITVMTDTIMKKGIPIE